MKGPSRPRTRSTIGTTMFLIALIAIGLASAIQSRQELARFEAEQAQLANTRILLLVSATRYQPYRPADVFRMTSDSRKR